LATLSDFVAVCTGEELIQLPEVLDAILGANTAIPSAVVRQAQAIGIQPLSELAWMNLTFLQRFTLIKLTRDSHDNINFLPAMREFDLLIDVDGAGQTVGSRFETSKGR
jgi:hypothetical protein